MSPLKRLAVDPRDGTLRMLWWDANNALKINPATAHHPGTTSLQLGAIRGAIVEGDVRWGEAWGGLCFPYAGRDGQADRAGTGFVASYIGFNGSHVITAESTAPNCATAGWSHAINDTLGVSRTAPEPSRGLQLLSGMRAEHVASFTSAFVLCELVSLSRR